MAASRIEGGESYLGVFMVQPGLSDDDGAVTQQGGRTTVCRYSERYFILREREFKHNARSKSGQELPRGRTKNGYLSTMMPLLV